MECNCGSAHDTAELGISYNLYEKIDTDKVQCLNEHEEGSGARVFKTWEERLDRSEVNRMKFLFYKYRMYIYIFFTKLSLWNIFSILFQYVESDIDAELLFNIP